MRSIIFCGSPILSGSFLRWAQHRLARYVWIQYLSYLGSKYISGEISVMYQAVIDIHKYPVHYNEDDSNPEEKKSRKSLKIWLLLIMHMTTNQFIKKYDSRITVLSDCAKLQKMHKQHRYANDRNFKTIYSKSYQTLASLAPCWNF